MKNTFKKLLICLATLPMVATLASCKENTSEEKEVQKVLVGDMLAMDTSYEVVLPSKPTASEEFAALELIEYFFKVTGQTLEIKYDSGIFLTKQSTYISIGNTSIYSSSKKEHNYDLSREALNTDGYVIYTYGSNIVINAYCDRGKLYGVYEFVEDTLGVKFLNYRYTHVEEQDVINLYKMDNLRVPYFQQRAYLNTPVFQHNTEYVRHMRFNTDYCPVDETNGGYTEWCQYNGNTSHTMVDIIPNKDYIVPGQVDALGNPLIKQEYREIFAHEGHGSALVQSWLNNASLLDYCFTSGVNDDGTYDDSNPINLVHMTIESLKKFILANPNCENYMIGQNDTPAGCTCDRCSEAVRKYHGGGRMIRFINLVSDGIKAWLKEIGSDRIINLTMFAYLYTNDAPVEADGSVSDPTCYPRDNVYIKYAPIKTAFYYSIDDDRQTTEDGKASLEKWRKITNRFHSWTYHCWYSNWLWYYPTLQALQGTMKYLYESGVVYHFAQGAYTEYNLYQADLDAYVFSKLAWDLNGDVVKYRNDYIRYYFGEDAYELMIEFQDIIALQYKLMEEAGENMTSGKQHTKAEYWPYEVTKRMVDCFLEAIEKTKANENLSEEQIDAYVENLERASITAKWMRLSEYARYAGVTDADVAEIAKDFVDLAEKYQFNKYGEPGNCNLADIKSQYNID